MAAQRYEISLSVEKYLDKPACLHFMINLSIKLNFNSLKDQHKNSKKDQMMANHHASAWQHAKIL